MMLEALEKLIDIVKVLLDIIEKQSSIILQYDEFYKLEEEQEKIINEAKRL